MSKRTLQLSVRDKPTAFDYFFDYDLLVVASRSDLAFYHLHDLGSPHRVIFYDQPLRCNLVKIQYGAQNLTACVNDGGYVSIWDPSKSVKPMLDFIHPSKQIADLRWSPNSQECLATCSSAGNLTLWDIRTILRPTHDMMVGKSCERIEYCPHNPYLMSASCEAKYLLVWDVRMMPSLIDDGFNGVEDNEEQHVHVIESEHGILNYAWNPASPTVSIVTDNGGIDEWMLNPAEEGSFESTRISSAQSSLVNENTKLLAGPYGDRLALLYQKPNSRESSVYIKRCSNTDQTSSSNESVYAASSFATDPFVKIGTSKSPILDMKWANSPIGSSNCESFSSDLDLLVLNEDSLLQVIHLPGAGGGGRPRRASSLFDGAQYFGAKRTPPAFAGFTPQSSSNSSNPSTNNLYSSANELAQFDGKNRLQYGLRGMKQSLLPSARDPLQDRPDSTTVDTRYRASTFGEVGTSTASLLAPQDSAKRDLTPTTPSGPLKRNSLGSKSFHGALPLASAFSINNAVYATNPHLMMVGPVKFYTLLEDDINALEYGINHGYLEGWRIGRIDQFSRRIVLELLIPNIDSYTITNTQQNASFSSYYRSEDLNSFYHKKGSSHVRVMELALQFPIKLVNFWYPTFSIEDKTGLGFNPAVLSSVIIELTAVCKSAAEKFHARNAAAESSALGNSTKAARPSMEPSSSINDCLLFQISRCFRKRLFKIWEKIIETDRINISYTTIQQQQGGGGESHILSTSLQSDHEMEVDEHAPYMKYIEDDAFRVPAPVCSAGIFNAKGQLICFGNAKICLTDPATSSGSGGALQRMCSVSATGKHKSYANTLVSKIITTSTTAESVETGAALPSSRSVEFEGVLAQSQDASQPPSGRVVSVPIIPPIVTFDKTHRSVPIPPADNSSTTQSSGSRARDRTSSDYSDALTPRGDGTDEEEEEEDYQFSFDHETTKEPLSPKNNVGDKHHSLRHSSHHSSRHSHHMSSMEEASQSDAPLDFAPVGGSFAEVYPRQSGQDSKIATLASDSLQSFGEEEDQEIAKKVINKHPLQVYHIAYRTELKLLHAYSVGPLMRREADGTAAATPITPVAQAVAYQIQAAAAQAASQSTSSSSTRGRGRSRSRSNPTPMASTPRSGCKVVHPLTQEEAHDRASACRYNAQIVQQFAPEDRGLSQFWNLLAVVLDMLTITDSGCLIDWNHCTIGLALLHRLYKYLREINDLQTFATAICIMGGSDILVDLLYPYYQSAEQDSSSSSKEEKRGNSIATKGDFEPYRVKKELESVLYVYNNVLHRWGEQLSAVEVSKHINFDHFSLHSQKEFLDAKSCEVCVKVCCYYCEKEIQPQRTENSGFSSRSGSATSLNNMNQSAKIATFSNASNTTTAQVTFYPGTQYATTVPAAHASVSRSSKLLWCQDCKDWAQRCVVCELAVRGTVSVCAKCGHGGHFSHMQNWFARSKVCASGCGCRCTEEEGQEKPSVDSSDDEEDMEEYAEDGENVHDMYDNIFGTNPPDYLEEIYNKSSDYNYNNFYDKWNDSQSQGVYYEFSS